MKKRQNTIRIGMLAGLVGLAGCTINYTGELGMLDEAAGQQSLTGSGASGEDAMSGVGMGRDLSGGAVVFDSDSGTGQEFRVSNRNMSIYGHVSPAGGGLGNSFDVGDDFRQVSFTSEGTDFDPEIGAGGKWMIYASTRDRPTADIYLQKVGTTTRQQLTGDPADDRMPTFSPDGKMFAYVSNRSGSWNIYLKDLAGNSRPIQLTDDDTDNYHPTFSPDGKKMIFTSYGRQSGQYELVMIDVERPKTSKKYLGINGLNPQWSPDGSKIAYQRARERGTTWFSLWMVEVNGDEVGSPISIANARNAGVITPAWSPTGSHLVFCTIVNPVADKNLRPTQSDIWVVNIDGTGKRNLSQSKYLNLQPTWSDDGTIYFVSNRSKNGVENIWSLKTNQTALIAKGKASGDGTAIVGEDDPSDPDE